MFTVRALTFFTGSISSRRELEEEFSLATSTLINVEKSLVERGYKVFTKRISFPGLTRELSLRLVEYSGKVFLISTGYSKLTREDIVELTANGIYTPILHSTSPSSEKAEEYVETIIEASRRSLLAATKIAIGFHSEDFVTPYFPDSSSPGSRFIGISLLYPKILLELLRSIGSLEEAFRAVFSEVERIVSIVKDTSRLSVKVDHSLSPWMSESVAEIYEYSGYSLLDPGALYYTWLLNKYISEYSNSEIKIGFNEVMLPYTEDYKLLEYGEQGLLTARKLLYYASTCVAGLDMVIVPEDKEKLKRLILDAMSLSVTKRKPMSLRAIPVPEKPGDKIDLGIFGKVTVIEY